MFGTVKKSLLRCNKRKEKKHEDKEKIKMIATRALKFNDERGKHRKARKAKMEENSKFMLIFNINDN